MNHTPTPWKQDCPEQGNGYCHIDREDAVCGLGGIATVWGAGDGLARENAEFIVQACNVHEDLVKALEWALGVIEIAEKNAPRIDWSIGHFGRKRLAQEALTKSGARA